MTGGYTASLGPTKLPDVHTKRMSVPTASQLQSSAASDSETDLKASAETAETAAHVLYKTNISHSAGTVHDQRLSLEMPTSVTSASSINLNFGRTYTKSRGCVRGTTVTNRIAASHVASRRKH